MIENPSEFDLKFTQVCFFHTIIPKSVRFDKVWEIKVRASDNERRSSCTQNFVVVSQIPLVRFCKLPESELVFGTFLHGNLKEQKLSHSKKGSNLSE